MGTSCPDHFLRTKISPFVLTEEEKIPALFDTYRKMYADYYEHANIRTALRCATQIRS